MTPDLWHVMGQRASMHFTDCTDQAWIIASCRSYDLAVQLMLSAVRSGAWAGVKITEA